MIRLIIADDHEFFRDGIAVILKDQQDIELVDQASNGEVLVAKVIQHRPDVVLTDIQMDVLNGVEATRIIHQRFPDIAIIAISMYGEPYTIVEMLQAGAVGYLVKNATKTMLIEAIRAAHAGENYYCHSSSQTISALIASGRFDPDNPGLNDFTAIELRIIQMICKETDNAAIAEQLGISVIAVKNHRKQVFEKAGVGSAAGLVVYAMRMGLYKL